MVWPANLLFRTVGVVDGVGVRVVVGEAFGPEGVAVGAAVEPWVAGARVDGADVGSASDGMLPVLHPAKVTASPTATIP